MKKVLIITYEMIPHTKYWGASQRVYYFAKFLCENGYHVDVIASKNTDTPYNFNKEINFRVVHLSNKWQPKDSNIEPNIKSETHQISLINRATLKFKHTLKKTYKSIDHAINNDPNKGMGFISKIWLQKNLEAIFNEIKTNNYNTIIISAPPFGLLQPNILKKIKSYSQAKLIIDYRDPWNCWNDRRGISFMREKKCLKKCDHIIVTNSNHQNKIIKDFSIEPSRVSIIMNGFDERIWNKVKNEFNGLAEQNEKISISYIGAISFKKDSYRNPTCVLTAFNKFKFSKNIKLTFIGVDLKEDEKKHLLEKYPFLELVPNVSQEESLKLMLRSDVLMNIHSSEDGSSRYLVGGKLFDYAQSGKFIFSINARDSYESTFIKSNNLGICVPNSETEIHETLSKIYEEWILNHEIIRKSFEFHDINKYTRTNQCKILIDVI